MYLSWCNSIEYELILQGYEGDTTLWKKNHITVNLFVPLFLSGFYIILHHSNITLSIMPEVMVFAMSESGSTIFVNKMGGAHVVFCLCTKAGVPTHF